jgi:type VI secretion system protein ImpC
VLAHKGEALVRLAGLEAINGDGLASAAGAARKPGAGNRIAVQAKLDKTGQAGVDWNPAQRGAGTVAVTAPARSLAEADEEDAAVEASTAEDAVNEDAAVDDADAGTAGSGDSELDALLASLDDDSAPAGEPAPEPAAGEEEDMDPELAALLKSLG